MFTRRNLLNGDARAVFLFMHSLLLGIAVLFYFDTFRDGYAFRPGVWGALAFSIPARAWAIALAMSSAMVIVGLVRPVWSRLVVVGAALQALQNAVLAYSSVYYGGTVVIGFYACGLLLPLNLWLLMEAALYRADGEVNDR